MPVIGSGETPSAPPAGRNLASPLPGTSATLAGSGTCRGVYGVNVSRDLWRLYDVQEHAERAARRAEAASAEARRRLEELRHRRFGGSLDERFPAASAELLAVPGTATRPPLDPAGQTGDVVFLAITVPKALRQRVRLAAVRAGASLQAYVVSALREGLASAGRHRSS